MKEQLIIGLFMLSGCATVFSLHHKLDNIGSEVERVQVESIVSSGKAIYLPGSVCVIKATSDIDKAKMRQFAAACIKSHEDWLLINNGNAIYSDAPQEVQH
tara:strand:+ start:1207 stop:1509 length:303 start_codon:yes stop_codon:yes gene_type:complete